MAISRSLSVVCQALYQHRAGFQVPTIEDPFQLILWEQVAYLVDDQRRHEAFRMLERRVGLSPQAILAAPVELLEEITAAGGSIACRKRAARMQDSARMVMSLWQGDLNQVLTLPEGKARQALTRFPMIGKPGAEKILLFTKTRCVLALDSNGLRVLLRLGYGTGGNSYEKTYQSVRSSTAGEEGADFDRLILLHRLLRRHGQEVCRQRQPECPRCPLTEICAYFCEHHGA